MERKSNENTWTPQFFEEEMQSIQPHYDLVMESSSSRPVTLLGPLLEDEYPNCNENDKANVYYDLPTDDEESINDLKREKETIMMMRNCGIESSLGGYLNSERTLPTHQTKLKAVYEKNLPILLDEIFFKLKPSSSLSSSNSSAELTSSANSSAELTSSNQDTENNNDEEQSPLDKILGINRNNSNTPLEEKFEEDFPNFNQSIQIKNKKRFCTPKNLYNSKKCRNP